MKNTGIQINVYLTNINIEFIETQRIDSTSFVKNQKNLQKIKASVLLPIHATFETVTTSIKNLEH